jgi:hypothetical protein
VTDDFEDIVSRMDEPPPGLARRAGADLLTGWRGLLGNIALNYRFPAQQEAIHVALTDLALTHTYVESVRIVRRRMNAYGNPEQRHPLEHQ